MKEKLETALAAKAMETVGNGCSHGYSTTLTRYSGIVDKISESKEVRETISESRLDKKTAQAERTGTLIKSQLKLRLRKT